MKEHKDIREDEIRVIGGDCPAPSKPPRRKWPIAVLCAVVGVCVLLLLFPTPQDSEPQSYFEEEDIPSVVVKSQQTDSLSDKSEVISRYWKRRSTTYRCSSTFPTTPV